MAKAQSEVVPYDRVELDAVREALLGNGRLEVPQEDPDTATRRIVDRILEGSADEALTPQTVQKSDDLVDEPLKLIAVDWASSDYSEGPGVFAVASCALLESSFAGERGEVVKVSLGGAQVIAQLYKLVTEGKLPVDVVIRKAQKATARGFYPKWLEYAKLQPAS